MASPPDSFVPRPHLPTPLIPPSRLKSWNYNPRSLNLKAHSRQGQKKKTKLISKPPPLPEYQYPFCIPDALRMWFYVLEAEAEDGAESEAGFGYKVRYCLKKTKRGLER